MDRHEDHQWALLALAICAFCLAPRPTRAIPAFARSQSRSCSHCHGPFPRLNETGERFLRTAFAPEEQAEPQPARRDVQDADLTLLDRLPLAAAAQLFFDIRNGSDEGDAAMDFKAPFGLQLLSGGRLADEIGYYFHFYLTDSAEGAGVSDAYLHFEGLFGSGLDLIVGQFQVSHPLFKRELRLTFQDYLLYAARHGLSASGLTTDRGLMLTYEFGFGLLLAGAIFNGSGKGGADLTQDFDLDRYKTYLLRATQDLGPVRIGLLGYWSKEEQARTLGPDRRPIETEEQRTNETLIWGPNLSLALGLAEINMQYLQRKDLNPYFRLTNERDPLYTHGLLIEAIARVYGDPGTLFLAALFNYVDSEAADTDDRPIREEAYSANLSYLLHTNLKLLAEYTFARFKQGAQVNEHRGIVGLVGAW
jgi:hypothetical protein